MNRLTDKDFSFKCPMSWDDMEDSTSGKFCSKCRKEVFDLTNCSVDEVRDLQEKHGSICGSIRVAQAAVVALSLSAAACQKMQRTTGAPLPMPESTKASQTKAAYKANSKPFKPENTPRLMGEICPPAVDSPKEVPPQEADPFQLNENHPRLMGKICPQPNQNENGDPGVKIDI